MTPIAVTLLVGLGGAGGAVLRFLTSRILAPAAGQADSRRLGIPVPTLVVNIAGSFLFGLVVRLFAIGAISEVWLVLLAIGFCGALTTMSTFALETVNLLAGPTRLAALGYMLLSLGFTVVAAAAGAGLPQLWL